MGTLPDQPEAVGRQAEQDDEAAAGAALIEASPRAAAAAATAEEGSIRSAAVGSSRRRAAPPDGAGRPQRRRRLVNYDESLWLRSIEDNGSGSENSGSDGEDSGSGSDSEEVCQPLRLVQQRHQPSPAQPPTAAAAPRSLQPPLQPPPPPAQPPQPPPQQPAGQQAACGPADLLQDVFAALAACVQAGRLQPAEQTKYAGVWRRMLSAESRQRDAVALRALSAGGRHEAAAALVRAALAQELPGAGQQQEQRQQEQRQQRRRQVEEEVAALKPLLERCVEAGELELGAAAVYAGVFCRLMQPADRQGDLQVFHAFAADREWEALGEMVAAALAQELPA